MSNPESYALTESLDIKLINMGKNENSRTYQHDLADFGTFLCQTPYIGASKCTSWTGFHFLINSNAMSQRYAMLFVFHLKFITEFSCLAI